MAERPKRRKHKDNPYTLEVCEERNIYKVYFKDGKGVNQCVEISEDIFKALDRFELDDLSELNEYDNHIEHSEIYERTLNKRAIDKPMGLEDIVIQKATFEDLRNAIKLLPTIQRKRIKLYYFEEMTMEEIAKIENCSIHSVFVSLERGKEKLKELLKK